MFTAFNMNEVKKSENSINIQKIKGQRDLKRDKSFLYTLLLIYVFCHHQIEGVCKSQNMWSDLIMETCNNCMYVKISIFISLTKTMLQFVTNDLGLRIS